MMLCDACGYEHEGQLLEDCPRCDGAGMPGAVVQVPLPRMCYSQREMKKVRGAIIHFMSGVSLSETAPFGLDLLVSIFKQYKVSAHYLITRQGTIIGLVQESNIAYHAGRSRMNGLDRCNNFTIGIELVGMKGLAYEPVQIEVLKNFLADLSVKYGFGPEWVQGHDVVRRNWNREYPEKRGSKKYDPGPLFPWDDVIDHLKGIQI